MARNKLTYEQIISEVTSDEGLTVKQRGWFHAFNPMGAVSDKMAADAEIDAAVDQGLLKSGAIIAYGGMNDYHYKRLMAFVMRKHCRGWDIDYHAKALRKDAAKARAAIDAAAAQKEAA